MRRIIVSTFNFGIRTAHHHDTGVALLNKKIIRHRRLGRFYPEDGAALAAYRACLILDNNRSLFSIHYAAVHLKAALVIAVKLKQITAYHARLHLRADCVYRAYFKVAVKEFQLRFLV